MVGHGWPRGGNGRNGPEQGPGPLDGSSLGVEMASLTQNKGLEPMTDTDQKKTWILTLLTTARQIRNGRPNFGLTRGVTHMGCPVGETAGRADPTGQKSHRLLLTKPGRGPWPKNPAPMAEDLGLGHGMQPTCHAGPIIMAGDARQEVHVPDDVYALNAGQDLPGLAGLLEAAPAAAAGTTPGGCGLARRSILHRNQLCRAAGGRPGGRGLARRSISQSLLC